MVRSPEHDLQAAVVSHIRLRAYACPELRWFLAIPNGGWRSPITARRLHAEGVQAGVADMFLPLPRGGYSGLFLEFKSPRGRLEKEQKVFLDDMAARGYECAVVRTVDEALRAIDEYMGEVTSD